MGGTSPCCAEDNLKKGSWTAIEDKFLVDYIQTHGHGKWRLLPRRAGLKRSGKSCRLRWLNYLRPGIKRGNITHDEEDLIIKFQRLLGNRWSLIASRLPGRTDNEIKNYWNTHIKKKLQNGNLKSSATSSTGYAHRSSTSAKQDSDSSEPDAKTSPNTASHVVRPKATRCTKVMLSKQVDPLIAAPFPTHNHEKIIEAPPLFLDHSIGNTNNPLDFMVDFETDQSFFSDLLKMDISEPSCFGNNRVMEDNNPPMNNVSDYSFHGTVGLQSISAFMEHESDWL